MQRLRRVALLCSAALLIGAAGPACAGPVPVAEPSFADVLARPDDPGLNLAYALRLVREGHLNSAAATLERVLLTHPEADDVRVTYMIVLYRLDDLAGAKREADILKTRKLSGGLAAEYARYAERIAAVAKPTRFSAYLGSGVRVDSNVTTTTDENGLKPRNGDVAYISMAGIAVEHRPGAGPIDAVFAQLNLGSRLNADHSDYNLWTGGAEAGLEKRFGGLVLRVSGFANAAAIDRDLFSRDVGGRALVSYELTGQVRLFAGLEGAYTSFSDVDIAANETRHDGGRVRVAGGIAYQITDQHLLTLQLGRSDKDAIDAAYAYTATDIEAKWLGTFVGGQYMSASARYANVDYDGLDTEYDAVRQDDVFRARVSYGLPVRTLGGWFGIDTSAAFFNFGDLVLQTSVDYVDQDSNISDFSYSNLGADVMLTRRFQF